MEVINIEQMKGIVEHVVLKDRTAWAFWGPSGVGKSEGIEQAAAEHDGILLNFRVSQYESVDFRGIPDIQHGATVWNMPATLPFKGNSRFEENNRPIFLFADEINQGDPSVTSVLYQLYDSRRIGEHILMDNVFLLAAGNRDQDRGNTNRFPDPLANRMGHSELVADVKVWSKWAQTVGKSMTLIGFLNFRNELLHTHDPAQPHKSFATPRSWVRAEQSFTNKALPETLRLPAISGQVGSGPATELLGFEQIMASIVPIEQIISDPEGVPIEGKLDVQWAMATHVSGHMTKEVAGPLNKFLNRLEPEMSVMAWTLAIQRDENITDSDAFLYDYAPRYRGLFS